MRKTLRLFKFGSIILPVLLLALIAMPALGQENPGAPAAVAEATPQDGLPGQAEQAPAPEQPQVPEKAPVAEQPKGPEQTQGPTEIQPPQQPQAPQPQFPQPQVPQVPQYPQPQMPQQPQVPQYPQPQMPQQPQYPQPQYINIDGVWGSMLNGQQVVMQVQGNQYQAWMNGAPFEGGVFQIQGNIMYGQAYGGVPFTRYVQMDPSGYYFTLSDPASGAYITYQRMQ